MYTYCKLNFIQLREDIFEYFGMKNIQIIKNQLTTFCDYHIILIQRQLLVIFAKNMEGGYDFYWTGFCWQPIIIGARLPKIGLRSGGVGLGYPKLCLRTTTHSLDPDVMLMVPA